jgi:sigma-B regulation protein RsbU (phosphoserine phosphatase)
VVPAEPRNIGVLYLDSRERGRLLSNPARSALETLAREAAGAIENARLYRETLEKARIEQELRTAAEIQQALLPPPHRAGTFFSAMATSIPCRAIGGDFFEYLDLPGGDFGFALGDVAGKGPPAAILTAVLQGIFAAQVFSDADAGGIMARINRALLSRGVESRFATAFLGILTAEGQLTYCNAGHNPPLLFDGDSMRRLDVGGTILGLFPKATYTHETVQLAPGAVVVVYSDGVSEALSADGVEFGEDRIRASVESILAETPERVVEDLLEAVETFAHGAPQTDDITALVLRYRGESSA